MNLKKRPLDFLGEKILKPDIYILKFLLLIYTYKPPLIIKPTSLISQKLHPFLGRLLHLICLLWTVSGLLYRYLGLGSVIKIKSF